jgi:cellulose synthase/poly-beta-1,6-N-acetylglucosamine synthase-like glycosyltransferase
LLLLLFLFWISLGIFLYHVLGYPIVITIASWLFPHRLKDSPTDLPEIDLIIPAHNEADVITAKLESVFANGYPREKLHVIVACDGCSDDTVQVARSAGADEVLDLPRGGKAAAINAAVAQGHSPILAFSDANALLLPVALEQLVKPFADSRVGAVAGEQRISRDVGAEGPYWRYESYLKRREALFASAAGSDGSIHALRRAVFRQLPTDRIIMDDLSLSMMAPEHGKRIAYAQEAAAVEGSSPTWRVEFRRKSRIMAGTLHSLGFSRRAFCNFPFLLVFFSHKILRYLGPWLILLALISGFWAWDSFITMLFHLGLWATILLSALGTIPLFRKAPLKFLAYFMLSQAALGAGWLAFFSRRHKPAWEKLR